MSDEINPYSRQMSAEQINRNFVAVNEWMKLQQKQFDDMFNKMQTMGLQITQLQAENILLRNQMNTYLVQMFDGGAT